MKRILVLLLAVLMCVGLCACSNKIECSFCGEKISSKAFFCEYCGASIAEFFEENIAGNELSDSERIIGVWRAVSGPWTYEYDFRRDGTCFGDGNMPSLNPSDDLNNNGDGYWSFVDGKLRVDYLGNNVSWGAGVAYYTYSFNSDGTELTIGTEDGSSGSFKYTVWTRLG